MTGVVALIADYIVTARGQPVPDAVRLAVVRCLFDLIAAAGAGLTDPAAVAVRQAARATMGDGPVPVWLTGQRLSVTGAAWANAAAGSAQDLDDGHRLARGHPGAAVIPAVLAVAQDMGATDDALIAAIAIGYEVGVTIAAARTSYGNSGTWAPYAVVAAAAALRGTPRLALEHAMAIAGESAPNQLFASAPPARDPAPEGSAVKEGIPWAVVTGLTALALAEAGHTGPRNILDSPPHYRFADDLALGTSAHVTRVYFKPYACCRHVHAPLDALLSVMGDHGITGPEIRSIAVETTSGALRISNRVRPTNLTDLQYSIPYCLALAALDGPDALLPVTEAALGRDDAADLAARVTLTLNPGFDARFPAETLSRVTVATVAGQFESAVTSPKGEVDAPLTWADLDRKFRCATRLAATDQQQAHIIAAVDAARGGTMSPLLGALARFNWATNG